MTVLDNVKINAAIPFFIEYNVQKAAIFGSFARGEVQINSDIDIIITFAGKYDLLDIIGLKQDLETLFSCPVDLLTFESLRNDSFSDNIRKEAKLIYEKN
jgi:uncharacterized protein